MKLFYGWRMVAAGSGLQFLQAALLQYSFGAYLAVLNEERGWTKTQLSGAAVLHQLEGALLGPVLGWFIDRFGPERLIRSGVFVLGGGFVLLSFVDSLLGFYGAIAVIALGIGMCGFFPLNIAVIAWFERFRARALSTMSLGLAFGGVAVPLVAASMATYGWRATAFGSGVIAILAGWPLARVIRGRPEDHGETLDGLPVPKQEPGADEAPAAPARRDFTWREALRTQAFWLISLGHGFALLVVGAVNVHAIAHIKESLGYTLAAAALVMTLLTAGQIIGMLLGWAIGDRFDKTRIAAACMLAHMAGLLVLAYAPGFAYLVLFTMLHGVAWGLRGPLMQAIRADYFGRRAIGMILGLSFMIVVLGQAIGPLFAGAMADITGNYRTGFTILALVAGLGSGFFLFAKKPALPAQA
jgi:MFS family permease